MQTIAVLITCFNRVDTTLKCLTHLFKSNLPQGYQLDVYLVDDNSPDQTGKLVLEKFPKITVIQGNGNLYWSGGMRLAWETAVNTKDYDFYLWLNDDTELKSDSLTIIMNDYYKIKDRGIESLIVGIFQDPLTKITTYSGRLNGRKIEPKGEPQICNYITGNFVLVPNLIFKTIGGLSKHFTHGMGDNDYGFRAIKSGFACYVTSQYVGFCKLNNNIKWFDPSNSFIQRVKLLFAKKSGNIVEYLRFIRIHKGIFHMILSIFKTLLRLFFPKMVV